MSFLIYLFVVVLLPSLALASPRLPQALFGSPQEDNPTSHGVSHGVLRSKSAVEDQPHARDKRWTAYWTHRDCYCSYWYGCRCTPRYVDAVRNGYGNVADGYQQLWGGYYGGNAGSYGNPGNYGYSPSSATWGVTSVTNPWTGYGYSYPYMYYGSPSYGYYG